MVTVPGTTIRFGGITLRPITTAGTDIILRTTGDTADTGMEEPIMVTRMVRRECIQQGDRGPLASLVRLVPPEVPKVDICRQAGEAPRRLLPERHAGRQRLHRLQLPELRPRGRRDRVLTVQGTAGAEAGQLLVRPLHSHVLQAAAAGVEEAAAAVDVHTRLRLRRQVHQALLPAAAVVAAAVEAGEGAAAVHQEVVLPVAVVVVEAVAECST